MAEPNSIYKCAICGNVVSVIETHQGELVCCGQPMNKLEAKTKEEGKEKHVPVLTIDKNKVIVKVGSIPHPMEDKHFIELIQLVRNNQVILEKHLTSKDKPEAEFGLDNTKGIKARIYCNIHGLWAN
jgi:superoxide reductase